MSPTAFKQQINQLLSELSRGLELCNAVLTNRRLGSTHAALDSLQTGLTLAISGTTTEFSTLRKLIGSRMDLGDEQSRTSLNRAIREVQGDVNTRLMDIAYPRGERERRDQQKPPGFRELLKKIERIENEVSHTLEGLGQRLQASKPVPKPTTTPEKTKPKFKADEVVISPKELDHLLEHMKNSWIETRVVGKPLWVNVFDDKKVSWERPVSGFVREMEIKKKVVRTPMWEQEQEYQRKPKRDVWEHQGGW